MYCMINLIFYLGHKRKCSRLTAIEKYALGFRQLLSYQCVLEFFLGVKAAAE
jgi:hypothetical protein